VAIPLKEIPIKAKKLTKKSSIEINSFSIILLFLGLDFIQH